MKTIEMMNAEQFAGLAIAAKVLRYLSDIMSDHATHPKEIEALNTVDKIADVFQEAAENDLDPDNSYTPEEYVDLIIETILE